jgi:hypothetical protein
MEDFHHKFEKNKLNNLIMVLFHFLFRLMLLVWVLIFKLKELYFMKHKRLKKEIAQKNLLMIL